MNAILFLLIEAVPYAANIFRDILGTNGEAIVVVLTLALSIVCLD